MALGGNPRDGARILVGDPLGIVLVQSGCEFRQIVLNCYVLEEVVSQTFGEQVMVDYCFDVDKRVDRQSAFGSKPIRDYSSNKRFGFQATTCSAKDVWVAFNDEGSGAVVRNGDLLRLFQMLGKEPVPGVITFPNGAKDRLPAFAVPGFHLLQGTC